MAVKAVNAAPADPAAMPRTLSHGHAGGDGDGEGDGPGLLPALDAANELGKRGYKLTVVKAQVAGDASSASDSDIEPVFSDSEESNRSAAPQFTVRMSESATNMSAPAAAASLSRAMSDSKSDSAEGVADTATVPCLPPLTLLRGADPDNHILRVRADAVSSMLRFYSERGDVQTCTTVLCVLRHSPVKPREERERQHILWTRGYIGACVHLRVCMRG